MNKISKFEVVGIFVSIAVMMIALVLVRFEFDTQKATALVSGSVEQGSVVVVDSSNSEQSNEQALANALVDSADLEGNLRDMIVDDVRVGSGPLVGPGDTVVVHYSGRTREGVEFDNSYNRGTPFTFTIGEGKVIEGWEKGLLDMQAGGERILVIPADMAYGNKQVGPIPANSILVFKVELLEIK